MADTLRSNPVAAASVLIRITLQPLPMRAAQLPYVFVRLSTSARASDTLRCGATSSASNDLAIRPDAVQKYSDPQIARDALQALDFACVGGYIRKVL